MRLKKNKVRGKEPWIQLESWILDQQSPIIISGHMQKYVYK
ncbi:hypothetical protein M5D96_007648 [Drosophila gunungcola]|uniref:Uncharacterized protein n=1 Tax=Drosophila gunungcola TaxID=103775 RepID=A0A9Q0BPF6_9MUSC|nr:hypothetical protein M5D96_007648 [Drosophila gunungcola]